jgi:hypothetical protein
MPDLPQPENPQSFLSPKYWLGPYAIAVSTLYLWGYWGSFHVNVLESIGLTDIIKAAVYPIASAFAFFAIGAILGEVFSPTLDLPPGGGANTAIGKFLRKVLPLAVTVYVLGVVFLLLAGPPEKWLVLPALLATLVYLPLKSTRLLAEEFKSDGARSIVVFLLAALPVSAYGRGILDATDVLAGNRYTYAVSDLPGQPCIASAKPEALPRYVGRANDRYVFFQPTNQAVSFIAVGEVKALVLKRHEQGDEVSAKLPSPRTPASSPAAIPASSPPSPSTSANGAG